MTHFTAHHRVDLSANRLSRRDAVGMLAAMALTATLPTRLLARQARVSPTLLDRSQVELAAGEPMAWRVVRDVAEVGAAAAFEERALGFAVASAPFSTLLLTNEATGSTRRLTPGQAAFVFGGTRQRRQSLGDSATSYLRIGLVPVAAADDAGGDRLLFAGEPFAAPAGKVLLSLERVELDDGDTAYAHPGLGQALVLVEQGELEAEQGEAAPLERMQTTVGSDTSYAIRSFAGGTALYGRRDATSVLIAALR